MTLLQHQDNQWQSYGLGGGALAIHKWREARIVPARQPNGLPTQVAVGLVHVANTTQVALSVGEQEPALFGRQAASEIMANLRRLIAAMTDQKSTP
jgi:hypothetical protein